jgi:hypothetical protein
MLNVVDEFTREWLSIRINRKLKSSDVIDVLSDLFILRGVPEHIRPDNGPEFNGYVESFNARLRDELRNGEIFYTLAEARVIVESWRRFDHTDHWATGPQPRRSSFRSPRGRQRYTNRLRRPR